MAQEQIEKLAMDYAKHNWPTDEYIGVYWDDERQADADSATPVLKWLSDKWLIVEKEKVDDIYSHAASKKNELQKTDAFFRDPLDFGKQCGITDVLECLIPDTFNPTEK